MQGVRQKRSSLKYTPSRRWSASATGKTAFQRRPSELEPKRSSKRCSITDVSSNGSLSDSRVTAFGIPFEQCTLTQQDLLEHYVIPDLLSRKALRDSVVANITDQVQKKIALKKLETQRKEEAIKKQQYLLRQKQTALLNNSSNYAKPWYLNKGTNPAAKNSKAKPSASKKSALSAKKNFDINPRRINTAVQISQQCKEALKRYRLVIAPASRPPVPVSSSKQVNLILRTNSAVVSIDSTSRTFAKGGLPSRRLSSVQRKKASGLLKSGHTLLSKEPKQEKLETLGLLKEED